MGRASWAPEFKYAAGSEETRVSVPDANTTLLRVRVERSHIQEEDLVTGGENSPWALGKG